MVPGRAAGRRSALRPARRGRHGAGRVRCSSTCRRSRRSRPPHFDARVRAAGHRFVDSPVSGGPARAATGTLALMVGASEADLAAAEPVLAALGTPNHVGAVGMGETVKLVNQILIANIMVANAEALVFAKKAGADIDVVREVILTATGANYLLDKWLPTTWLSGSFDGGFALDLLRKDLGAALDAAQGTGRAVAGLGAGLPDVYGGVGQRPRPRRLLGGRHVLSRCSRSRRRGKSVTADALRRDRRRHQLDPSDRRRVRLDVRHDARGLQGPRDGAARQRRRDGARPALASKAMGKGIDAIARFVAGARARGAERIRAVATSAVREAGERR